MLLTSHEGGFDWHLINDKHDKKPHYDWYEFQHGLKRKKRGKIKIQKERTPFHRYVVEEVTMLYNAYMHGKENRPVLFVVFFISEP